MISLRDAFSHIFPWAEKSIKKKNPWRREKNSLGLDKLERAANAVRWELQIGEIPRKW